MTTLNPKTARFGSFELTLDSGALLREGRPIRLPEKPLQVLIALLERPGEIVLREDLRRRLWPADTYVDFDNNLNTAVNRLRETLGDSAARPRYIETVPKRGYRFVAPCEWAQGGETRSSQADVLSGPVSRSRFLWSSVTVLGSILLLLGIFGLRYGEPAENGRAVSDRTRIAVLPFVNLDPSSDEGYFSDGLTEEVIGQLSRLDPAQLGVIARTSVMQYKQTQKDVSSIGRELDVQFVLEGSVRRLEEGVRISAKLIQVSDQTQLWAEVYEDRGNDSITIQDSISRSVARSLTPRLLPGLRKDPVPRPDTNAAAYDAYLKGRYLSHERDLDSLQRSIAFFRQAISADSGFAPAYAGLADAFYWLPVPPGQKYPEAEKAALEALRLDGSLAEAHHRLANLKLYYDWDWNGAQEHFQRALALRPGWELAHRSYAGYLSSLGRHEEALSEIRLAMELDPVSVAVSADTGWYYYVARQYGRAIEQCRKALEIEPRHPGAHFYLFLALMAAEHQMEALTVAREYMVMEGASAGDLSPLESEDSAEAARAFWRWWLRTLESRAGREYVSPGRQALAYVALGENDTALTLLEKAHEQHADWLIPFLRVYPQLDPLRSNPRFAKLIGSVDFPG